MLASQPSSIHIEQPGLSELIVPSFEQHSYELMLPMLSHLSHQSGDRWLTWISSERHPKQLFEYYGFKLNSVRQIRSESDEETLWLMWETLNNGTSAFVVGDFADNVSVQSRERHLLEQACANGHSRALVLKLPSVH